MAGGTFFTLSLAAPCVLASRLEVPLGVFLILSGIDHFTNAGMMSGYAKPRNVPLAHPAVCRCC